jgi:hypothetical protein
MKVTELMGSGDPAVANRVAEAMLSSTSPAGGCGRDLKVACCRAQWRAFGADG